MLFVVTGSGWLKEGKLMTPIAAGDVIFVRPGEPHGVVAGSTGMAILGCQAPPDPKRERLAHQAGR